MELSFLIFTDLAAKFMVGLTGFLMIRCKLCKKEVGKLIASYTLYFSGPCSLFNAYQREFSIQLLLRLGLAIGISVCIILLSMMMSFGVKKIFKIDEVSRASLVYSNNGSFTISLVNSLLGNEAVFYLSGYISANILMFFSFDFGKLSGRKKFSWKNLLNPNVISIFAGLVCFIFSIKIPAVPINAIRTIAQMHGPLTMVMLGIAIGSCDIRKTFSKIPVWTLSIARLIIFPVIEIVILALCGITGNNHELYTMMNVLVIAASCPIANNILQATLLNKSIAKQTLDVATMSTVVSTCLCIISIPLMVMLYGVIS